MNEYDENELINKNYKCAEKGDKSSIDFLYELAIKKVDNFFVKYQKICKYWDRCLNENEIFTKEEIKEIIMLSIEILKYIPSSNGRILFLGFVVDNAEYLYKETGIVQPTFFNDIFDKQLFSFDNEEDKKDYIIIMAKKNIRFKAILERFSYSIVNDKKVDINDTNWITVANHIETIAKQVGWDGRYNNRIDIKESFMFARVHDMKIGMDSKNTFTKEGNIKVLTTLLSDFIKDFLIKHKDFPKKEEAIILSNIYALKNEQEYEQYVNNHLDIKCSIKEAYDCFTKYASLHMNDNDAICVDLAIKTIANSKTNNFEQLNLMLLMVLFNEKDSGILSLNIDRDYLVVWGLVAWVVDFEDWYEENFNDRIIGNSGFDRLNDNLNIKNTNKTYNKLTNDVTIINNNDIHKKNEPVIKNEDSIKESDSNYISKNDFERKNDRDVAKNVFISEDDILNNKLRVKRGGNDKEKIFVSYDAISNHTSYASTKKSRGNIVLYLIKKAVTMFFVILSLLIVILVFHNFNNKYKFVNVTMFENELNALNDFANKVISFTSEKISYFADLIDIKVVQKVKINNDELIDNKIIATVPEGEPKMKANDEDIVKGMDFNNLEKSVTKDSIPKNAVKLVDSIKKIDLSNAIINFNVKQNAWNLKFADNTMARDSIYIIDYINPITIEPCCSTYYFDDEGRMLVGWGIDRFGYYYYFDDDTYNVGKMCTGLKLIDDEYYYFLDNGRLLIDDYTPDGHYADKNGILVIDDSNKEKSLIDKYSLQ